MTVCDDPTVSVVLSWTDGLLVIPPTCDGAEGIWWNALTLPDWSPRQTTAAPSAWQPGQVLLSSVVDAASIPMVVAVRGETLAGLLDQQEVLREALDQHPMSVSIIADGTPLGQWSAFPTVPRWLTPVSPRAVSMLTTEAAFSLTVNPPGA